VDDRDVFGFARPRGHDGAPAGSLARLDRGARFGDGAGLVRLDQHGIAHPAGRRVSHALSVGDQEIVADDLNPRAGRRGESPDPLGVVLGEWVLDRDDGVTVHPRKQEIRQAIAVDFAPIGAEGIASMASELRRCHVERDSDVVERPVAGTLDRPHQHRQRAVVGLERRPVSSLVCDTVHRAGLAHQLAGRAIDFGRHDERGVEARRAERDDHEVLNLRAAAGMHAAAEDLHFWHRQTDAVPLREVRVQRRVLRCRGRVKDGHGSRDHGVAAEPRLRWRAVERDEDMVHVRLEQGILP